MTVIENDPQGGADSKRRAEDLEKRVVRLAEKPALNFFDLAGLLKALHDDDPSSLRFLPRKMGITLRGLYYLLDVGRLIEEYEIDRSDADAVGSTKLQAIARHVVTTGKASREEVASYIELAKVTRSHLLRATLRQGRVSVTRAVTFRLGTEDRSELNSALVTFGAEPARKGLAKRDEALMSLVMAALSTKGQR